MEDSFQFRNHLCIVFELLNINLYEFIKMNSFRGCKMTLIQRFAVQILMALSHCKKNEVIH
jgi:serine/threonine protein kinase